MARCASGHRSASMGWKQMRFWIVLFWALLLAACGGGGGGSSSGGGSSAGGGSPPAAARPTSGEAAYFLTQASFGPTDASIDDVVNRGYRAWLDEQMAMPVTAPTHQAHVEARRQQRAVANNNPDEGFRREDFYESWWMQSVASNDQLRQRIKFAYSQIFVISLVQENIDTRGAASYYDMLGRNAFGNFRTLLRDVTLHPQMGKYLTFLANQREATNGTRTPDENYAREVMQLFTIGLHELNPDGTERLVNGRPVDTYTPADVSGLAKVFTGISWYHPAPTNSTFFGGNGDPNREVTAMSFYPQYHSVSEKRFLGAVIPPQTTPDVAASLNTALDTLFNHPNVGPFISERLIQQLVTSNPSPAYVGRVAAVFANNGQGVRGDMAAVIRAILLDAEARRIETATATSGGKLREPVVRIANYLRAFEATSQTGNWLITATNNWGQTPLAANSVFNFWRPGFVPAGTSQLGQRDLRAPEMQIVDEVQTANYINNLQNIIQNGIGSTPQGGSRRDVQTLHARETVVANDPEALADRINRLLMYGQMQPGLRARVVAAINAIAIPSGTNVTQAQIDAARLNRVRAAVFVAMASPDYLVQR